ncbi:nucleosome assembly protein 1-like 1 isoform X2 [Zerene cesonia]|uniref:nucleosome assembly protein 1-like 1 isoform X2 n=1 Tax=Zerene cesonia TaxID=33412 RepID=UPI0018E5758E|nr:nucleosome assembly protein 1-like 1 isoform X2 [Zerene cesonia]
MGSVKQSKKTRSGRTSSSESESGQDDAIVRDDELVQHLMRSMHTENIAALPPNVRRRIKALRALQKEFIDIEAKFYSEVHELECKYAKLYKPLFDKRAQVVTGAYEPTDEECHIPWQDDTEEALAKAVESAGLADKDKNAENKTEEPAMDPNVKGIPEFWLTIFKNVSKLCEMVQEHDEPILKSLQDIKVQMHDDPLGFTLEFHFAPNEYFTNNILTKQYSLKFKPDDDNPLDFEGPEIYACKGCEIDWKKGKNVTVKMIKKKQKHKSLGSVRTVTKTVQADSFFNFFKPPAMPEDPNLTLASDTQMLLALDFEVGHYIRERVVSRAVLLYTGEGLVDDDYEEEEDSYSDEDSGTEEVSDAED